MPNSRKTGTHADDSAPGVGDGPAGVPPPVGAKVRGRGAVWIGVLVVCLIVLVAFFTHPLGGASRGASGQATPAATSATPGAASAPVAVQNPAAPTGGANGG